MRRLLANHEPSLAITCCCWLQIFRLPNDSEARHARFDGTYRLFRKLGDGLGESGPAG